jgi:hypothetical protein
LYWAFYIPNILYKKDAEEKINGCSVSTNTSDLTCVVRIVKDAVLMLTLQLKNNQGEISKALHPGGMRSPPTSSERALENDCNK